MMEKPIRWRLKKWTQSAYMQPCSILIPGHCNGNPETTVFAHDNGGGMGTKTDDWNGADMCSSCHDVFDGRVKSIYSKADLRDMFASARMMTIANRLTRKIVR